MKKKHNNKNRGFSPKVEEAAQNILPTPTKQCPLPSEKISEQNITSTHRFNKINISVRFIINAADLIHIANITTPRLPWLHQEKSDFLQLELNKYILGNKMIDCESVESRIADLLATDLNSVGYNISFSLEAEWVDFCGNAKNFLATIPLNFIDYAKELQNSSKEISNCKCDATHFNLAPHGKPSKIRVLVNKRAWLSGLNVYIDDILVNTQKLAMPIEKDISYNVLVDNIPLKKYILLNKKSKIRLDFDFSGKLFNHSINDTSYCYDEKLIPTSENLVVLFMDMGSTYTKFIVAQSDMSGNIKKINRCTGPKLTSEYCEDISVNFDKKQKVEMGAEALAEWLIQSLRQISKAHYDKKEIIHTVYWSFPAIDGIVNEGYYQKVSSIVSARAETFLYGNFILVPEHISLKHMFDHVLKTLAEVGSRKIDEINDINKNIISENMAKQIHHKARINDYIEYKNRYWFTKLFATEVYHPGDLKLKNKVSIPDYYNDCLKVGCHNGLKNFIIIDAGGYSFDVYGEIGNVSLKKSFEAGGQQLTKLLKDYMQSKGISNDPEQEKKLSCQAGACRSYSSKCKEWTNLIYLDSINKVCTFVTDNLKKSGAQGISLVLTGQAFKNVFLSKLLLEKLNLCERSVQTSSKISDLLQTNPELLKDSTLGLFYLTTCQNEPETIMPKSDFDIVGGSLLSHQNRSMETKL